MKSRKTKTGQREIYTKTRIIEVASRCNRLTHLPTVERNNFKVTFREMIIYNSL